MKPLFLSRLFPRYTLMLLLSLLMITSSMSYGAPRMIPAAPKIAAKSWLLMDANSGHVIVEHNADDMLPPASLTKLMTAYIAFEQIASGNISPEDNVSISEKAWRKGGSKMYVREGTQVKLIDLMRGIIVQSGNDASIAAAEHIAGSEDAFADLMNQHAKALGMNNTQFQNATGWPAPEHYTTARDLALVARASVFNHPEYYKLYAEKDYTYNDITQPNRNKLLWRDPSVDGMKTGHTQEAGYCLVSSAERDGMRLIAVVMGAKSPNARATESMKLLTYGFRFFETITSFKKGAEVATPQLWMGQQDTVPVTVTEDLYLTIPRGAAADMQATVNIPEQLKAPITANQPLGDLVLTLDGKEVKRAPLVALEPVAEAGFFKRIWQSIVLFFKGLF